MSVEKVTPVTSLTQFKEIIGQDKFSVFDFWATWCGPCRVISPVFEKLSKEYPGIEFYKVDVDDQPEISEEAGIRAMPTFKLYRGGQQVEELVGASPLQLQNLLKKAA